MIQRACSRFRASVPLTLKDGVMKQSQNAAFVNPGDAGAALPGSSQRNAPATSIGRASATKADAPETRRAAAGAHQPPRLPGAAQRGSGLSCSISPSVFSYPAALDCNAPESRPDSVIVALLTEL